MPDEQHGESRMRVATARRAFRMEPVDAMWHWLAAKFGTDQFITYAFAGAPASVEDAVTAVLERARAHPNLALRVRDDRFGLRYPEWVSTAVVREQCVVHTLSEPTWERFLDALAGLTLHHLDPREHTWRLHVFSPVAGVPGCSGNATVVVAQFPHVLGDGLRAAALAGVMLGRDSGPDPIVAPEHVSFGRRAADAVRERRALSRDVASGRVPPIREAVPALSTNAGPSDQRVLRTLVVPVTALPGPTPTIGALIAVSDALSGYLAARGEDTAQLTAGVPVAKSGAAHAFNHIDTALVGLHPDTPRGERVRLIAADLAGGRLRLDHPAVAARERVFAAVPAGIRRWGVSRADLSTGHATVPGHTVVSSVARGPADLQFGGCPVLFSAGYPILLPICSLTHGVHVLGDTVAVSVHSTDAFDVDEYVERLAFALDG